MSSCISVASLSGCAAGKADGPWEGGKEEGEGLGGWQGSSDPPGLGDLSETFA